MKTIFIAFAVLTFIVSTPEAHALLGHVAQEKERRQQAEQRIVQEQQINGQLLHTNQTLYVTISILSAGVVTALIVGTAIGSKAKRDHGR